MLGNMDRPFSSWGYGLAWIWTVWICPFALGISMAVLIWDGYGLSRTHVDFFDFEVGGHDSANKGRIHVIVPFIGRKNGNLTAWQQLYDDVHGWYRAHIEHLLGQSWHWGLVRNMWHGGPDELHQSAWFVALHANLPSDAGLSPSLWTMGPCSASCLD